MHVQVRVLCVIGLTALVGCEDSPAMWEGMQGSRPDASAARSDGDRPTAASDLGAGQDSQPDPAGGVASDAGRDFSDGVIPSASPARDDPPPGRPVGLANPPPRSAPSSGDVDPYALSIRLVRGVALAQTLPDGTAMGFNVQYQVSGAPRTSALYRWVIRPPAGPAWEAPADLTSNTLTTFVKQWGPVRGDYHVSIVEVVGGARRPVSNELSLTYAY